MLNNRAVLLIEAQELAARFAGTGLNPDSLFVFTTLEIVGILAYLKRLGLGDKEPVGGSGGG